MPTKSKSAEGLKRLREQSKLSVRAVASALGRKASSYSFYEDSYKKPLLPLALIKSLVPILVPRGVALKDLLSLAGAEDLVEAEVEPSPEQPRPAKTKPGSMQIDFGGDIYVAIERYDLQAAAGAGRTAPASPKVLHHHLFRLQWLRRVTAAPFASLFVMEVLGDSMNPALHTGDTVLVDTTQTHPRRRDGLYVLNRDGEMQVKRVSAHPVTGRLSIRSDNPAYDSYSDIDPAEIIVVGLVIWIGRQV